MSSTTKTSSSILLAAAGVALSLVACVTRDTAAIAPPASSATVAFVDIDVVPLDSERVLVDQTVLVDGDRIVALGPASTIAVPPAATRIDGHGKVLLPGLVDMHVHLNDAADLPLYLARGVTTVRNMWGTPIHLEWRKRIAEGSLVGPTIVTAGPILDSDPPLHDGSLVVRTEEDADRAVAMHTRVGYDFIKVYSKLSLPVYRRIVADAKAAGLKVAGHVPREVGLEGVIDAHQSSVEHLTGFVDALQADGSPVRGKFDRGSLGLKLENLDLTKLPALAEKAASAGVWQCPTLTVITNRSAAEVRQKLEAPEMQFIAPLYLAMWQPRPDPPADVLARNARENALHDEIIQAIHRAHGRFLVGTDTGNPLVVPGYALHDELRSLVRAGLTPYEVLRAATHDASEYLGTDRRVGVVAVGQRADLLMISGNPLQDVTNTQNIEGVMARGRWFDRRALEALLAKVAEGAKHEGDRFAGLAPLTVDGRRAFDAMFEVVWKGARFGVEQVAAGELADGRLSIAARSFDRQYGQRTSLRLDENGSKDGARVSLESDGAKGRGHLDVNRTGDKVHLGGVLLSGVAIERDEDSPRTTLFGVADFVAPQIRVGKHVASLSIGQSTRIDFGELALGSNADLSATSLEVTRAPDVTLTIRGVETAARRFEISKAKGSNRTLWLDAAGWPLQFEFQTYGGTVSYRRIAPG